MAVNMTLVLASASPRRKQLLTEAGYRCEVRPVDVDESQQPGEAPERYVERVARLKAETCARQMPDRTIVAADTAVVVDDDVFGKPIDAADATRMLERLSGRAHLVMTGVVVIGQRQVSAVETTTVQFDALSPSDIAWYVASGEPMDKAGGYAIQGLASRFIPRIDGSYSNVVGLPIATLVRLLTEAGRKGVSGRFPPRS
jgi:septum formation protein